MALSGALPGHVVEQLHQNAIGAVTALRTQDWMTAMRDSIPREAQDQDEVNLKVFITILWRCVASYSPQAILDGMIKWNESCTDQTTAALAGLFMDILASTNVLKGMRLEDRLSALDAAFSTLVRWAMRNRDASRQQTGGIMQDLSTMLVRHPVLGDALVLRRASSRRADSLAFDKLLRRTARISPDRITILICRALLKLNFRKVDPLYQGMAEAAKASTVKERVQALHTALSIFNNGTETRFLTKYARTTRYTCTCGNYRTLLVDTEEEFQACREYKRCSGCGQQMYCSVACQRKDWKEGGHKQLCSKVALENKA